MKTKYVLWILCVGLFGWIACDDDSETLTPSDIAEYELVFPQGNHDYDARIVDWFDRTGIYMLYKFNTMDCYAALTSGWQEAYPDTTKNTVYYKLSTSDYVEEDVVYFGGAAYRLGETRFSDLEWRIVTLDDRMLCVIDYSVRYKGKYLIQEADEQYVGMQLDFWEEAFLNNYSDSLLRAVLPLKILLGRDLKLTMGNNMGFDDYASYSFSTNFMLSYGDESVRTMTNAEKRKIAANENYKFIRANFDDIPLDEFYAVTDYTPFTEEPLPVQEECYSHGLVRHVTYPYAVDRLQGDDKYYFLDMIYKTPYEQLIAEPASDAYNATDLTGILHPKKDKNGLIRKKYEIMIRVYKAHGIDLQAIGDAFSEN